MPVLRRSYSWSPRERSQCFVVSKRKFWNPKKWFRKKQKTSEDAHTQEIRQLHQEQDGAARSRSTSELSVDDDGRDDERRHSSSMHPGLSVSHDSVFHPLNSGSSDLELDGAQSSSSLSISQPLCDAKLQSELSSRLRLRRGRGDTSEDDEGLPGSPLCGSPAAATDSYLILEKTANKDLPTKSHSTCSDGSLLSMDDSSEIDEDSIAFSRHSSKVSLQEKRIEIDTDLELGPVSIQQLNHSAAHHRVSVRPKRTYGAPRRKKGQLPSALPATPEVNEESSIRSISPEVISRAGASLATSESFRLKKSKLHVSGKSQDDASSTYEEEREEKPSFFERIFPRRSGKVKKKFDKAEEVVKSEEKIVYVSSTHQSMSKSYTESTSVHTKTDIVKPIVAPRTGAASRQRVQPIDIPAPARDTHDSGVLLSPEKTSSPEKSLFGSSPIQAELETILRQRMSQQKPSSPVLGTPPISPRISKRHLPNVASKVEQSYTNRFTRQEVKNEEFRISNFPLKSHNPEATKSSTEDLVSSDVLLKNYEENQKITYNELGQSKRDKNINTAESIDKPLSNIDLRSKIHHENLNNEFKKEETLFFNDISHHSVQMSSVKEFRSSQSDIKKTINEDVRSRIKIAGLSSLQQKVLSLNEDDQNDGFKSLSQLPVRSSKPVIKSHSFKTKLEDKSSIEFEDDNTFERRKSLKAASLDSLKNVDNLTVYKDLLSENLASKDIKTESETENILRKYINKVSSSPESITISGPSHTAIVSISSSEDFQSRKTKSQLEDATKKVNKENNVSITKIHLKHEQTQVTKSNITISKQDIPEFLNKQLNKVEVNPTSNVVFSMKSPKIVSSDEKIESKENNIFEFIKKNTEDVKSSEPHKEEQMGKRPTSVELKPKPVFVRTNSKEMERSRPSKTSLIKPELTKDTSKEIETQLNHIKGTIDDKPTFRPKTLNFLSKDQDTIQKPVFLRNNSKEDSSPKAILATRPKTLFNFNQNNDSEPFKPVIVRSISKENSNLDSPKESPKTPPFVSVAPLTPTSGPKYIKNEIKSSRKTSIVNSSNSELNKMKSASLDSLKSTKNISSIDKSSQDSIDNFDKPSPNEKVLKKASQDSLDKIEKISPTEGVILRRKSLQKHKEDDQPELMKVFARRSLKLKDEDIADLQEALTQQKPVTTEQKSIDSDKENSSKLPVENSNIKNLKNKEETLEVKVEIKKPIIVENKSDIIKNSTNDEFEVQLRRPFTHNIFLNQRTQSLNPPRNISSDHFVKKQASFHDKTDNFIKCEERNFQTVEETKTETNNFRQKRAEWEKRVQQFNK